MTIRQAVKSAIKGVAGRVLWKHTAEQKPTPPTSTPRRPTPKAARVPPATPASRTTPEHVSLMIAHAKKVQAASVRRGPPAPRTPDVTPLIKASATGAGAEGHVEEASPPKA